MSDKNKIVMHKDGIYRLECGAIAKVIEFRDSALSMPARMKLIDWSKVDREAIESYQRNAFDWWFDGCEPYYWPNGRVDRNRDGHPLNVKEEILP